MWSSLTIAGGSFPMYNLTLAAGVLLSVLMLTLAARRKRMALAFLADHFFLLFITTFVVARLVEVLLLGYSFLDLLLFWQDMAFNFYGGVAGFLVALYFVCRRKGEDFFAWLDLTALTAGFILIFHHVGTFLAGTDCGVHTGLPIGVTFTDPAVDAACLASPPVHPLQLYAAALAVLFFWVAAFVFRRTRVAGQAGALLLLTFSLVTFALDFLRADSAPVFGGLRVSQYFALGFIVLAAFLMVRLKQHSHHTRRPELDLTPPAK